MQWKLAEQLDRLVVRMDRFECMVGICIGQAHQGLAAIQSTCRQAIGKSWDCVHGQQAAQLKGGIKAAYRFECRICLSGCRQPHTPLHKNRRLRVDCLPFQKHRVCRIESHIKGLRQVIHPPQHDKH